MFLVNRSFSLTTCRTYAKWLKRRAVRVLTSEESEQFHSTRRKSPDLKPCADAETAEKTLASVSGADQNNVTFEPLQKGDPRFG